MKVKKSTVKDDHLLQDLRREAWNEEVIGALHEEGVTTYKQLFELIQNEQANPELRADVCDEIHRLYKWIDKRRFVPPLLKALRSSHERVRQNAIRALTNLDSKHAVEPIIELVCDQTQSWYMRYLAINGLYVIGDKRAIPALRGIMFDKDDDVNARALAVEWTAHFHEPTLLDDYINLLSAPETELRFWAAFGLGIMWLDITPALSELDRIAAFDDTVTPSCWHNDREALQGLERCYWRLLGLGEVESFKWHPELRLISPALEYSTFRTQYRQWDEDGSWTLRPLAPIEMRVEPKWLEANIRNRWPDAKVNIRQPRPQTYLLDWMVTVENNHLIGGLHRDQHALVLMGDEKLSIAFANWYRDLFPSEQTLYIYEWADFGTELKVGMTDANTQHAIRLTNEKHTFRPE